MCQPISGYAYVDSAGRPFTRVMGTCAGDTGWVEGFKASNGAVTATWTIGSFPSLNVGPDLCTANWPPT